MSAPASSVLPPVTPAAYDDDRPEPPKRDGRRTHIVDRALDYVALADQGLSAARIARKRRRSQGYVSIALRLGRAIVGMEPDEIAALRSPRITWKLAQRVVREDADVIGIRHQLRAALGGFSSHNLDGRKHRKGRRAAAAPERAIGVAWGWDAAWFARDPIGFAESHLQYLAGLQRTVRQRAARSAAARGVERVSVGQGIRTLQRSLAAARAPFGADPSAAPDAAPDVRVRPAEQCALAVLEILERKLAEARAEAAALLAASAPSGPSRGVRPTPSIGRPRLVGSVVGALGGPLCVGHGAEDSVTDALEADLLD